MPLEYKAPTHANEVPHQARLEYIQVPTLVANAQEALVEFSSAVDDELTGVTVEGVCVVGSTVTDSFTSGVSDCDVYLLLDQSYDNSAGFCRMLNSGQSACRMWVNEALGDIFTGIDVLGAFGPEGQNRHIRPPAAYLYPEGGT